MSERALPDNVLRTILSGLLTVSDARFLGGPDFGDYSRRPRRQRQVLLVSKRWHRVGLPLLYSSLVLRHKDHTASVAALLRRTPGLGKVIRSLKLVRGFGKDLVDIVLRAPNIQHLYINLDIYSWESLAGITKALPLLQPKALFLVLRSWHTWNQKKRVLAECVAEVVERDWLGLKCVCLADRFAFYPSIVRALIEAPALALLSVFWEDMQNVMLRTPEESPLIPLLNKPTLKAVACRGKYYSEGVATRIAVAPALRHARHQVVFVDHPDDARLRRLEEAEEHL